MWQRHKMRTGLLSLQANLTRVFPYLTSSLSRVWGRFSAGFLVGIWVGFSMELGSWGARTRGVGRVTQDLKDMYTARYDAA